MVKKYELKFWAKQVEVLHVIIFILTVSAMLAIFLTERYKLISAFYIFGLYTIERFYSICPLTRLENVLLATAGVPVRSNRFIPRFFKENLHIRIPDWLAEIALMIFFMISSYIIVSYLIINLSFSPVY